MIATLTEGDTTGLMFIVIPVEVTVAGLAQALEEVMLQLITSPLARVDVV